MNINLKQKIIQLVKNDPMILYLGVIETTQLGLGAI